MVLYSTGLERKLTNTADKQRKFTPNSSTLIKAQLPVSATEPGTETVRCENKTMYYQTHRGVRNPMKISDIGFLKTEPNRTDLKIQKPRPRFPRFGFQNTNFGSLGLAQFFMLSHSQFILQHDRINSQHIFLHAISLHF